MSSGLSTCSAHGGHPARRPARRATLRAGLLLLLLAVLGVVTLTGGGRALEQARDQVDTWGMWAPLAFAVLYALTVTALAPAIVLTTSAGVLFGVVTGTATVLTGATAGAALSFALARRLGRSAVARWAADGRLAQPATLMARRGFTAVLLLRLVPGP
ncbi:TVP38/TMEM64 family protein [Streptomyces canus]|uniref:TVP38/TMEM64 family protein n=1 Tax=Streptomyces canus TaxID=58343 RepID=UPI0037FB53FB